MPFHLLIDKYPDDMSRIFQSGVGPAPNGKYLHWDKLRHLEPPCGLNSEQWWLGIKLARGMLDRVIPLRDEKGHFFSFALTPQVHEALHRIDSLASGRIAMPEQITNPSTRERYLFRSLVEEAITSSQLEGASTTRKKAMEMIRSGRLPTDKSEQMIFNNLKGMRFIRDNQDKPLTPQLVLDIHRYMAEKTIPASSVGRLQQPDEERVSVVSNTTGEILHSPPPAEQLPERLELMCAFANGELDDEFIHPVIRAILLHLWLGHDHPFEDGNGRTARALFYWSMLNAGYWLFEFISISTILKRASAQYGRSYLYTETDDNDATYFIVYQLDVITRALHLLDIYLAKKAKEIEKTEALLHTSGKFNSRQLALLSHVIRNPGAEFTIRSHQISHGVAYATARNDLMKLVEAEMLEERLIGRAAHYYPTLHLSHLATEEK